MRLASSMTGSGQTHPAAVELEVGRRVTGPASCRISRDHVGQHGEERVDVGLGGVAGQRDPDVAVGEHAHRRQHVARLERRGGAGRAAGDPEAAPVQLVTSASPST